MCIVMQMRRSKCVCDFMQMCMLFSFKELASVGTPHAEWRFNSLLVRAMSVCKLCGERAVVKFR